MSQLSEALERQLRKIQLPGAPPLPVVSTVVENSPSEKQVDFFKSLVAKKQLTDAQRAQMLDSLAALDKRAISSTIQWLIGLPWMPRQFVQPVLMPLRPQFDILYPGIIQGCYAIGNPVTEFYKVSRPKEGKWAGYVFLSQLSGENHIPIRDRQASRCGLQPPGP